MERTAVGLALVAVFAVAVLGVAASSIDSAPIRGGFGIEGGSEDNGNISLSNASSAPSGGGGGGSVGGNFDGGGFDGGGSGGSGGGSSTPLLVLAALAGVAVAGIGLVFWATGDDADPLADVGPATEEPTDADGTEAERSGPVEPANEVYRAWWEMARRTGTDSTRTRSSVPCTDSLRNVKRSSLSPAEFATAAIEAGMDPEAVAELTRLFRGVRYGGASITDETERRATAALDRVRSPNDAPDSGTER